MRTLTIETATAACSVALFEDGRLLAERHEVVGRGHAERLLPAIAELPDGGRAEAILVDVGPGSFTGIRVGLAAARALALGWRAEALGFSAPALVAARALAEPGAPAALAVVMEGGHGELFMQAFATSPFRALAPVRSLPPQAALSAAGTLPVRGSGAAQLLALAPGLDAANALPRAADALLLPEGCRSLPPVPLYGRAPDAVPPR